MVFWILYYLARFSDPGYLAPNRRQYDEALRMIGNPASWSNYSELSNPVFLMCHTCKLVRPIRGKHCRRCNRCVDHFDHHCSWLGSCVGYGNRMYFLFFVYILITKGLIGGYLLWLVLRIEGFSFVPFLAGAMLAGYAIPALYQGGYQVGGATQCIYIQFTI